MPLLFSYGTLQLPEVQQDTFGRLLPGRPAVLPGWAPAQVPIADPARARALGRTHHDDIIPTGDPAHRVRGAVLEVTAEELVRADGYESAFGYDRVTVVLESGERAWVYRHGRQPAGR